MTIEEFREQVLTLPETTQAPHFDRTAFKVVGKRIFATLHKESETANLKFSEVDQSVFCSFHKDAIYPVKNKWGLQGWTCFELSKLPEELMVDAINTAYKAVFKK